MDNFNFHILVDAKTEFTKQLCNILTPRILEGISSIYDLAVEICDRHNDNTQYLRKFQSVLGHIPKWSQDVIDKEYERIKKKAECDWLDELINAVFVSHVKVMAAIKVGNKAKNAIDIKIPNASYFIHKCYIEVARRIWKKPYVFFHKVSSIDLQRGLSEAEVIIESGIQETIRSLLPVKAILKEYLGNNFEDEDLNEDDISKAISTQTKNNLRKIVQQELENYKATSINESIRTTETVPTEVAEVVRVDINTPIPELPKQELPIPELPNPELPKEAEETPKPDEVKIVESLPEPEPVPVSETGDDVKQVDLTADTEINRKIETIEKTADGLFEDLANVPDVDMNEIERILASEANKPSNAQDVLNKLNMNKSKKSDDEIVFFDDL